MLAFSVGTEAGGDAGHLTASAEQKMFWKKACIHIGDTREDEMLSSSNSRGGEEGTGQSVCAGEGQQGGRSLSSPPPPPLFFPPPDPARDDIAKRQQLIECMPLCAKVQGIGREGGARAVGRPPDGQPFGSGPPGAHASGRRGCIVQLSGGDLRGRSAGRGGGGCSRRCGCQAGGRGD